MATTKQKVNADTKPQGPEQLDVEMMNLFSGEPINWSKLFTKIAIGYAYGIVAYIGGINIINMVLIMTNVVWLQYIIAFVGLVMLFMTIFKTAPLVADVVYNAGAWVGVKAKSLFGSAKERFSNFEMPAFATKH